MNATIEELGGCALVDYLAGGWGEELGCGVGEAAGVADAAGDAEAAGVGVTAGAGAAAAGCCGWAAGLIQQAWTRMSRLRGTLSSIWSPKRVRQRKAAWTWPPGQPNRS